MFQQHYLLWEEGVSMQKKSFKDSDLYLPQLFCRGSARHVRLYSNMQGSDNTSLA